LIILINKIDLVDEKQINEIESLLKGRKCIRTSVKEGTGISELENAITELFVQGEVSVNEEILLTNIRHKNLLIWQYQALKRRWNP